VPLVEEQACAGDERRQECKQGADNKAPCEDTKDGKGPIGAGTSALRQWRRVDRQTPSGEIEKATHHDRGGNQGNGESANETLEGAQSRGAQGHYRQSTKHEKEDGIIGQIRNSWLREVGNNTRRNTDGGTTGG